MNTIKNLFTKNNLLLAGAALLGVLYFYNQGPADPDAIIIAKIEKLQNEYDTLWNAEGRPLAETKEILYKQEQELSKKLDAIGIAIEEEKKRAKKDMLKEWSPAYVQYYADANKKKYRLIEDAIGGAESGSGMVFEYASPSDLFYTCLKKDGCYVTQSDVEHVQRNGYIATDIGTNNQNIPVRLPDYLGKEVVYTLKYVKYGKTTGNTIEAFAEVDGVKFMWRIGHVHFKYNNTDYEKLYHNKQLKTGTIVGYSGGETEYSFKNGGDQGATTGKHVHIEYLIWDGAKYMPMFYRINSRFNKHVEESIIPVAEAKEMVTNNIDELVKYLSNLPNPKQNIVPTSNKNNAGKEMFPRSIFVTSYNPETKQTDGDPRTGASGVAMKEGMIALSRDLLFPNNNLPNFNGYNPNSPLKYGMKIKLTSHIPQCNGVFEVQDTMAKRYGNRADLFYETRDKNTSCWAVMELVE